jgi:aldehyde dehydrogenase (NAD+)
MSTTLLSFLVGGEWLIGEANGLDRNPGRPEEVVAEVSFADAELMTRAVEQARGAFAGWRDTASPARGEILWRAADLLEARAEEIGRDLVREEGKALVESIGETRRAAAVSRYFASQTLEPDGETYPSSNERTLLYARREPLGVVAAITSWNFPIAIPAWKITPALAYGNVVVWKPAAIVPLTAVHMARALVDAGLPPGVLNLVFGRGAQVGDALVTHEAWRR